MSGGSYDYLYWQADVGDDLSLSDLSSMADRLAALAPGSRAAIDTANLLQSIRQNAALHEVWQIVESFDSGDNSRGQADTAIAAYEHGPSELHDATAQQQRGADTTSTDTGTGRAAEGRTSVMEALAGLADCDLSDHLADLTTIDRIAWRIHVAVIDQLPTRTIAIVHKTTGEVARTVDMTGRSEIDVGLVVNGLGNELDHEIWRVTDSGR